MENRRHFSERLYFCVVCGCVMLQAPAIRSECVQHVRRYFVPGSGRLDVGHRRADRRRERTSVAAGATSPGHGHLHGPVRQLDASPTSALPLGTASLDANLLFASCCPPCLQVTIRSYLLVASPSWVDFSTGFASDRVVRSSCLYPMVSSAHCTLRPALQHLET